MYRLRCNANTNLEENILGIYVTLYRHGGYVNMATKYVREKVWERDGKQYMAKKVAKIANVCISTAKKRLRQWAAGEITHNDLLAANYETEAPSKEDIGLLKKIPGPTSFEQQHPEIFG